MSEDQKKQLEQQLWNIANTLRGKMNADEFRDYILGFIFYKYLAEKWIIKVNDNYTYFINKTLIWGIQKILIFLTSKKFNKMI